MGTTAESADTKRDNIFAAMGMADADERLAKAEIARVIRKEIAARGLTQTEAGERMGLKQSEVSDLVRGKLARFSRLRLEKCLSAFDLHVRLQIGRPSESMGRAGLDVELVDHF
jgi:predicted XRE-type DNA-binding protein